VAPEPQLGGFSLPRLRIIHTGGEVLVVICDAKLIGKEFKQGEFKLRVDGSFYGGREASVEECIEALREATIANMVGSIIKHAIKEGIIDSANVMMIKGVPHAQMVRM